MKFSCEKALLQSACATVSRAAASKSPIPALEGLLIEAAGDKIKITGYDLKKAIFTTIEGNIEENGATVLTAKLFGEMIRRMPDGIVTVSSDENDNVSVRCGKNEYNFTGLAAGDYPELPNVDEMNNISLPQKTLANMLTKTLFAVSTNEVRPIYTGILFDIEDDMLTLVAVDGFRLAKRTEKIEEGKMENCSFVVPGHTLSDIEKICSDEGSVSISVGSKHISFEMGDTVVITRKIEGDFLNYKKSIPTAFKYTVKAIKSEFMSSIDRVAIIVSEKNSSPVRITFNDGIIKCVSMTSVGKAQDECICEGNGEGMEIGFNDRYIMDALKAAGSDEIILCMNTPSAPFIIKAADGSENFVYMVLPVRLRAAG